MSRCIYSMGVTLLIPVSERARYNIGLILVVLTLFVTSILAYRIWGEMHEDIEPATADELLAPFDEACAAGDIDDEEYARLRQHIQDAQARYPVARPSKRSGP